MSTPTPPPPQSRLTPPRLLGAVAFAAVGFVAVWQGFGLAGFGTDAHALRVLAAVAPLFASGLVLVWPDAKMPFVVVVLLGLWVATAAWWYAPSAVGARSLQSAVAARDQMTTPLANSTLDEHEEYGKHTAIRVGALHREYPSLCKDLPGTFDRWATVVADDLIARYRKTPLDDFKSAEALNEPARGLARTHPASADRLDAARRQWLSNAIHTKTHALLALKPGDWAGFDATAPGRRALADALPNTRDALLRAEVEWVDSSVESIVANKFTPKAGEAPPKREFWKQTNWDVLALKSLDAEDNRFAKARGRLFKVAHDDAKSEAAAHLDASRYDLAFGVARTHSVDWSATVLGEAEQKSITDLRGTYKYLDTLAAKSAKPPERAPPPRTKP